MGALDNIVEKVGAFIYYDANPERKKSFEQLKPEQKEPYLAYAKSAILGIGKLDLTIAPTIKHAEAFDERIKNKRYLEDIIKAFANCMVTRKQKLIKPEIFPAGELALWIMQGRTK